MLSKVKDLIQAAKTIALKLRQRVNSRSSKLVWRLVIACIWLAISGHDTLEASITSMITMDFGDLMSTDIRSLGALAWLVRLVQELSELVLQTLKFSHKLTHARHDYHLVRNSLGEIRRYVLGSQKNKQRLKFNWRRMRAAIRYLRWKMTR